MRRVRGLPILILVLAGAVVWAATWYLARSQGESGAEERLHVVDRGPVELTLKETGVVLPRQTVAVKSKVPGRIREIQVAEGDEVEEGQLLAVIEPDIQTSLTLSEKRMALHRLAIDLAQKEREWKRQSRLHDEGLAPAQMAEETERDWRTAESFFLQARTALNLLEREANQPETSRAALTGGGRSELTDYRILAPMAGVVAKVHVKPGELATSGTSGFSPEGALLMEIADEKELEVRVDINEIDIPRVSMGMRASITLAATPGNEIEATVSRMAVAPKREAGDSSTSLVVYPVAFRLPERPPGLRQGMSATVDLTLAALEDVVRIPTLGFVSRDGKTWVKLWKDEQFEDREVALGLKGDKFAEVRSGLEAKDVIAERYPSGKE